jgi:sugar lactone lactonase YvrE
VNGTGTNAEFNYPFGVAVDTNGNVYVGDQNNNVIRKVTPVGGVTTLAEGFNDPTGVAVDSGGNVYVGDSYNYTIRKVTPAGVVTTLAGLAGVPGSADGTNSAARFNDPTGVALDSAGNLYVADTYNDTIRKVTPAGVVTTPAGLAVGNPGSADGTGSAARFYNPIGVAVDSAGKLYVADMLNQTIRKVTPAGGVTTLAGKAGHPGFVNGAGTNAEFNYPFGVAVDTNGNVYVGDQSNNAIRKVTPAGGVTNLAEGFNDPTGVAVDSGGNVYVADSGNNAIQKVTPAGEVTTVATGFNFPSGVAVDSAGNLYVADTYNDTIRKVTPVGTTWVVTTLAGLAGVPGSADGTNSAARFNQPWAVAVDTNGNVYVGDGGNWTIRKLTPVGANWVVTTLAGLAGSYGSWDGTGSAAGFYYPDGLAVDSTGNLYVTENVNNTIRKGFPASSVPAPNLQPPSLSAGQFGFGITGLPGLAVNIESSGDLSQWQVLGTVILEGGTNFFVSPNPSLGAQFYRGHVR